MLRKSFSSLLLVIFLVSISYSQNSKKVTETKWEVLVIREISEKRNSFTRKTLEYRNYQYLTSNVSFEGTASLEWLKDSSWELVGTTNYGENNNYTSLYFKRLYNKERTEKEIERLKKEFEKEANALKELIQENELTDLDMLEAKEKLKEYNKNQEIKLRNALEKVKNIPIEIISVKSQSRRLNEQSVGAEIVIDATPVLLKSDSSYRSTEAEKYAQETIKSILEQMQLSLPKEIRSNTDAIVKGVYKPKLGDFSFSIINVNLMISFVIKANNKQNIVAQSYIQSKFLEN
ncbi:MAG: hypothetical protein MUC29_08100 [Pyrinomonadaceae bacterium]|jgi:hypothetical protein|nr:hypothetical protein [Pyrinomonadaceae bacterium]